MKWFYVAALWLMVPFCARAQDTLTNNSIIKLAGLGLGKAVILKKINSSPCRFNVSVSGLEQLQKAKVPEDIISVMLSKESSPQTIVSIPIGVPNQKLEPGIYYLDSVSHTFVEVDPAVITSTKSGGVDQAILRSISGLFKGKEKAVLPGVTSNYAVPQRPIFAFVFDSSKKSLNDDAYSWGNIRSPNEFTLVKMTVSKNSREFVIYSENNLQTESGIEAKSKVPFTAEKVKDRLYHVSIPSGLPKGEYGFIYTNSNKVYEFSVK